MESRVCLAVSQASHSYLVLSKFLGRRSTKAWQRAKSENMERSFCERNFVSGPTMATILAVRGQLMGQLRASGFVRARGGSDIRDLNANSDNWAVVKAALCAGSYPNLLRVDRERQQLVAQCVFQLLACRFSALCFPWYLVS